MPLSGGCSITAFRNNISKLIREGMPRDQAVAASISTLRRSCKSRGKPMPDIGETIPLDEGEVSLEEVLAVLSQMDDVDLVVAKKPTAVWGTYDYFPAEEKGICTWCGKPEGSLACQNNHP